MGIGDAQARCLLWATTLRRPNIGFHVRAEGTLLGAIYGCARTCSRITKQRMASSSNGIASATLTRPDRLMGSKPSPMGMDAVEVGDDSSFYGTLDQGERLGGSERRSEEDYPMGGEN